MEIRNPATGELIREVQEDNAGTLSDKFQMLYTACKSWSRTPLEERVNIFNKFAGLLLENTKYLSEILTGEVGKPLLQSRNEIKGAITRVKWLTEHATQYLSDEFISSTTGLEEKISYEPLGVICNISAWNYPYLVGVNIFVPALLAGNAVLYKPSEYATLTGIEIERLLLQAGVPFQVFQTAIGGAAAGEILTELPFNGYFFTGSYKTGRAIYEKVAPKMVPCHCELGGKDPLYVADDVTNIKAVAAATADGAFYNNGQSCCAVERIYVHEKVYDEYIRELVQEVRSWKIGPPEAPGVYIGPLTRKEQPAFLQRQVDDAVEKGAVVLTGGNRISGNGYFFEPTVLAKVNHQMSIMKDETFGPVIGIMKVRDDNEAVSLMKDTEFGLTAAVYSRDKQRAENILREIDAGTGYWNCCDRVSPALPWSGRNHSGIGVSLSHLGFRAFVKPKAYHLVLPE